MIFTQRIVITAIEALAGAIIFVPLLFLINRFFFRSVKITTVYSVFAFYLSAVYAIVGLPTVYNFSFDTFVYLLPFVGMKYDVTNSILNVILFVPLGVFLPILSDKYTKFKNTLVFGFLASLVIELLQFFTYRKTDINDIITNTTGAVLGFVLVSLIIKKTPQIRLDGKAGNLLAVAALTVLVMFFVQPLISSAVWKIIS